MVSLYFTGSGVDYYLFKEPGSYEVYCTLDSSISCQVTVVDGENTTVNSDDDDEEKDRYKAVIYIHAGLMALSFGVLLPLGAFLAHYRVLLVHKITQPLGILLAISGFVFAIVYVELNGREHFDELIHGVLGLVLVLLVLLVMPALLIRRKWRCWHRRCGHIIAFFGMGNVLLVRMLIWLAPLTSSICISFKSTHVVELSYGINTNCLKQGMGGIEPSTVYSWITTCCIYRYWMSRHL